MVNKNQWDDEWADLILKALEAGMTLESIREFFKSYKDENSLESIRKKN